MGELDRTEGVHLYQEGSVEVRYPPLRFNEHYVWVGAESFFFRPGYLKKIASLTPPEKLEMALSLCNETLPHILKQNQVPFETFALILARARMTELKNELIQARIRVSNLEVQLR